MKKFIILLLAVAIVMSAVPAMAQRGSGSVDFQKDSVVDKVGDWFATRGKTPEEAKTIIAERKATRAAKRAQKEAERQKKILAREAEKAKKQMGKQAKDIKKSFGR